MIYKPKAAIYARVSTTEQTTRNQVEICEKFCSDKGWDDPIIYCDTISGSTSSRPAFNQMMDELRKYKFRYLVVTKLDRLGRSLQHLISILDELKLKKVEFIAVTQNIDTSTAAGNLQWQIMGAFAEFERKIISERTKEGMRNAKNVGKRGKDKKPRIKRGVLRK
jgi:DNA invertase Pin-like site-specific DNA recombinase